MTFAMFVDTSSLDKLIARTTTVSHFAAGEVLSVEEQLGGESTSSNANTGFPDVFEGVSRIAMKIINKAYSDQFSPGGGVPLQKFRFIDQIKSNQLCFYSVWTE